MLGPPDAVTARESAGDAVAIRFDDRSVSVALTHGRSTDVMSVPSRRVGPRRFD